MRVRHIRDTVARARAVVAVAWPLMTTFFAGALCMFVVTWGAFRMGGISRYQMAVLDQFEEGMNDMALARERAELVLMLTDRVFNDMPGLQLTMDSAQAVSDGID